MSEPVSFRQVMDYGPGMDDDAARAEIGLWLARAIDNYRPGIGRTVRTAKWSVEDHAPDLRRMTLEASIEFDS